MHSASSSPPTHIYHMYKYTCTTHAHTHTHTYANIYKLSLSLSNSQHLSDLFSCVMLSSLSSLCRSWPVRRGRRHRFHWSASADDPGSFTDGGGGPEGAGGHEKGQGADGAADKNQAAAEKQRRADWLVLGLLLPWQKNKDGQTG